MVYRLHIVGISPRTGTTLLAECMREGFDISDYENHEAPLRKLKNVRDIYLTKNPQDLIYCKLRLFLDKRLYVICLMRDPRDVVVSKHLRKKSDYWTDLGKWKKRYPIFKKICNHERFITVKYEDLVSNPDSVQEYINLKIPFLNKKESFSEFYLSENIHRDSAHALGGARPINRSSIGNWKNHRRRIQEQIRLYGDISNELVELGYENDDNWMKSFSHNKIKEKFYYKDPAFNTFEKLLIYPFSSILCYLYYLFGFNRC